MKKFRILSSLLLIFICFLFLIKFAFYPISSAILKEFGIAYDFSSPAFSFGDGFSVKNISFSYNDAVSAKASSLSFRFGRKFSGIFKNHFVVSKLEILDADVSVNMDLLKSDDGLNIEADSEQNTENFLAGIKGMPFFPLEEINIRNLNFALTSEEKVIFKTEDLSLTGNGKYLLNMPKNSVINDLAFSLVFGFTAEDRFYAVDSLKLDMEGISVDAGRSDEDKDGRLNGGIAVKLDELSKMLGTDLHGELYLDFTSENIAEYIPKLIKSNSAKKSHEEPKEGQIDFSILEILPEMTLTLTVADLRFYDFRPWDIHGSIRITPAATFIEGLNFFHKNKVSLSLDGDFPYASKNISGVVKLYDFDFDDCLRRVGTSGIVNMITSGTVSYRFDIEKLRAEDMAADLLVTEFDVGKKELLDLSRDLSVTGHLAIGPDGVDLYDALVKTSDDSSHLILKKCHYGFADTMKFHLPIVAGSWIDLEDVRMIAGFDVKGRGPIEVLIDGFYTNPEITSSFSGSSCHFSGFNSDSCSIGINLRDFVFDILIHNIRQKSISSHDSKVSIDFGAPDMPVYFKINKAEGRLSDASALFGVNTDDYSGWASMQAEGLFKNGLEKLSGEVKVKDLKKKDEKGDIKIVDLIDVKLYEKDAEKLAGTGEILYGRNAVKIDAEIAKKDLESTMSARFDAFYPEDFEFYDTVKFGRPDLDVKLEGVLGTPEITGNLNVPNLEVSGIKTGDFSATAKYRGENKDVSVTGKLGKQVNFSVELPECDAERFKADINVRDYRQKLEDFYIKFSLDAEIRGDKINTYVKNLKMQKDVFFVQNVKPFVISGDFNAVKLDGRTYFEGETTNFYLEGGLDLKTFDPDIRANGIFFLRTLGMSETYNSNSFDGRLYFDMSYANSILNGRVTLADVRYIIQNPRIVLNDFNGTLTIENNKWKLERLSGKAGDGNIRIAGQGTGLMPLENASLNLSAVNLTGKYAAIGDFAVSANIDLIAFSEDQFSLSGDAELKNIIYSQPLSLDNDFIKKVSKLGRKKAGAAIDKSRPIDLNLKILGKNNLKIRTNLIESDIFMDLMLTGTTVNPDISGSIILKNGKLEYKQNDFSITRGNITFEGDGINPFIDLESNRNVTTKVQDTQKDFKITMSATGYPFEGDLDLTFDSSPQLDQEQLRSLLLWGNIGDSFSGDLAIAAATDMMGITTEVRKNFNLSKFELVPKYSEIDEKTVLKLIAEKEIYRNLYLMLETNPSDTMDQIIELKYKNKRVETILGWKNKDLLETNFGGIGFDLKLEFIFE